MHIVSMACTKTGINILMSKELAAAYEGKKVELVPGVEEISGTHVPTITIRASTKAHASVGRVAKDKLHGEDVGYISVGNNNAAWKVLPKFGRTEFDADETPEGIKIFIDGVLRPLINKTAKRVAAPPTDAEEISAAVRAINNLKSRLKKQLTLTISDTGGLVASIVVRQEFS